MQHEIGNRTYLIAPVEPLDVDGVRTVQVGTGLFLLGFLGLLPFYGRLEETGRTWVLWMCLTGVGLGLLGTSTASAGAATAPSSTRRMADAPVSRWERGGDKNLGYGKRFAELVASGADVDGEARLADTLSLDRRGSSTPARAWVGWPPTCTTAGTASSRPSRIRGLSSSPGVPTRRRRAPARHPRA